MNEAVMELLVLLNGSKLRLIDSRAQTSVPGRHDMYDAFPAFWTRPTFILAGLRG